MDAKRPSDSFQQDTFISHLVELRDRMLRALIAIGVVFIALFIYPGPGEIYDLLALPMIKQLPAGTTMIATGVVSPFGTPIKVTGMAAFLVVLPYVLYQAWAFVAPGLYMHEKRLVMPLIVTSTVLFLTGVAFSYFFVFGQVFKFIAAFAPKSITPAPDIEQYLSFVLTMFLAFGLAFEVPVALIVLVRLGVVQIEKLKEWRPYFIVGAFVVAAVVTPPDVVSQLALGIPMCLLYELGIIMARMFSKPAGTTDWKAPSESEMDRELDQAEQESRDPK
jgi:sec-independent protein translocase protein TatC